MKVLWFTNTPSNYNKGQHFYHGGGWMESLETLLESESSIQLGVSFFHNTDNKKVIKNNTSYYPILKKSGSSSPLKTLIGNWKGSIEDESIVDRLVNVVDDFKPDIIHVFGSEGVFSKVQEKVDIPLIIHLQGLLNPYHSTFYPINQSKWNFILSASYFKNNILGNSPVFMAKAMKNKAVREEQFLSNTKYVMGRTSWDKLIAKFYNPEVSYFHINEVLRSGFYESNTVTGLPFKKGEAIHIISTISATIYKGIDVVLKTANLLKMNTNVDFVWTIIGLEKGNKLWMHYEKTLKINHKNVNVDLVGVKSSDELIELMKGSDLFIHPSYIDNSPNSVCEAQMLGVPIIACNVGGVSSLISNNETGFLVPSNGTYEISNHIINYMEDPESYKKIGLKGSKIAKIRHNRDKIIEDLSNCYTKIVQECNM